MHYYSHIKKVGSNPNLTRPVPKNLIPDPTFRTLTGPTRKSLKPDSTHPVNFETQPVEPNPTCVEP